MFELLIYMCCRTTFLLQPAKAFVSAYDECPTPKILKTLKYLHLIFHIGWNIHTVSSVIGTDCYNSVNFLSTEIASAFA